MLSFFNEISELHISFNSCLQNMLELLSNSIYEINNTDFKELLKESFSYEHAQYTESQITNIINSNNSINKLIMLIEPSNKTSIRTEFVSVNDGNLTESGKLICYNIGANPKDLSLNFLQKLVDMFYLYKFDNKVEQIFSGFILYLLYERIHPHSNGNGRIGRYLFLENKLLIKKNYVPLSKLLSCNAKSIIINDIMKSIFKHISFKDKICSDEYNLYNRYESIDKYYDLNLDRKLIYQICYIIYVCNISKYLKEHNVDIDKNNILIAISNYKFAQKYKLFHLEEYNRLVSIIDYNKHLNFLETIFIELY